MEEQKASATRQNERAAADRSNTSILNTSQKSIVLKKQATILTQGTQKLGQEKQVNRVENVDGQSDDEPIGSVNIQTDAVFDFKDTEMRSSTTGKDSYKKQKSQVSFKSRSSKRSGGVPMPPTIYGETQQKLRQQTKNNAESKHDSSSILNVSHLLSEHQHPDKINALIQRDNARIGDQNLLLNPNIPKGDSSSLLAPFPRTLQKQTTGRNDKKNEMRVAQDSSSLILQPGFIIQRGLTKVENDDQNGADTLDHQSPDLLGVTSLKSITRPSNVSGMASVISPSIKSRDYPGRHSDDSQDSHSDFIKPSVHFEQLDQVTETNPISQHDKNIDDKSAKSFKTADSKTIVTVETQIQILDGNRKKETTVAAAGPPDKNQKADDSRSKKSVVISDKKSDNTKTGGTKSIKSTSNDSVIVNGQVVPASSAPKKVSNIAKGTKTVVQKVKERQLISSRAQRDVVSEKNFHDLDSNESTPIASPGDKSRPTIVGLESIAEQNERPTIRIDELGAASPQPGDNLATPTLTPTAQNQTQQKQAPAEPIKPFSQQNQSTATKQQEVLLDTVSISTVPKKKQAAPSTTKKKKPGKDRDEINENPFDHDTRQILSYQLFAQDFFSRVTGQQAADPAQVAQMLGFDETAEKSEMSLEKTGEKDKSFAKSIIDSSNSSPIKDFKIPLSTAQKIQELQKQKQEEAKNKNQMGGLRRQAGIRDKEKSQDKNEPAEAEGEGLDRVQALEKQVQELKALLQLKDKQQVTDPHTGAVGNYQNNKGYVNQMQIHQPVYNINIFEANKSSRSGSPDGQRQPSFHAMSKPPRPNSSNIYTANVTQDIKERRKRPSTAAGVGTRVARQPQPEERQLLKQEGQQASAIDFQVQDRPISAATYVPRAGGRNNQRQYMLTDGQISDYRFKQEQALVEFLQQNASNQFDVPTVGQKPRDRGTLRTVNDKIQIEDLMREGHFFRPMTNVGSQQAIQKTRSCYLNVATKSTSKDILPNTQYVQTNAGRTGYVSVPNKSQKILERAYKVESKTLNHPQPLDLKTEPMRSLKGCVYNEMVHLHMQKNRNKNAYQRNKQKEKKSVSRHNRLASAAAAQRSGKTAAEKNEDLFFSPINDFMEQNYTSEGGAGGRNKQMQETGASDDNANSSDSREEVPALTGNTHIMMERDFFQNNYALEQNGKQLVLSETHFQPVFFSKGTEELRNNISAQQALKQYRIFVKPEDMHKEIVKEGLPEMKIAESLEQRLKRQEERDLAEYRKRKEEEERQHKLDRNPGLHRQGNIGGHDPKLTGRQSDRSGRNVTQRGVPQGRKSISGGKINASKRRMMLYKLQSGMMNSGIQGLIGPADKSPGLGGLGLVSPVTSETTHDKSPTMFPPQKEPSVKKPPPLTEKQQEFVKRLSQAKVPLPRRMLKDKVDEKPRLSTTSDVKTQKRRTSDLNKSSSTKPMKRETSVVSNSSDKSSNIFSIQKGSPGLQGKTIKIKETTISTEKQLQTVRKLVSNSGPKITSLRPFSASTGGGNYPRMFNKSTQRENYNPENLRKSETPKLNILAEKPPMKQKSLGLFSNSTTTTRLVRNNRKQTEPSVLSSEHARAGSSKMGLNNRKVTSSSDKYTNKSNSQKTGTATDQGTNVALTKHITSKFSETHTNTESDNTAKTKLIEKIPSNIQEAGTAQRKTVIKVGSPGGQSDIQLEVVVPSLVNNSPDADDERRSPLLSSDKVHMVSDESTDMTPIVGTSGKKSSFQKSPINDEEEKLNISVSVTPLDDMISANQMVKQKETSKFFSTGTELFGEDSISRQISPPQQEYMEVQITKDENFGSRMRDQDTPGVESKMQFLIDDSHSSSLTSSEVGAKTPKASTQVSPDRLLIPTNAPSLSKISKHDTLKIEKRDKPSLKVQIVPNLGINEIQNKRGRYRIKDNQSGQSFQDNYLDALIRIPPSEKPNTDRNLKNASSYQDSSQNSQRRHHQDMNHVLNVPMTSYKRAKMKQRQPTKDSQSSVLTPMFYKNQKTGGTPSAHSEFSFAIDLNQRELQGELKMSQGSMSQSPSKPLDKKENIQSYSQTSKRDKDSRVGSHIQYSDTTSEERSKRVINNTDLLELGINDTEAVQKITNGDDTPKSAHVAVKPIFQVEQF